MNLTKITSYGLPDFEELAGDDRVDVFDGIRYVIEIATKDIYRIYSYDDPDVQKWDEAKKFNDFIVYIADNSDAKHLYYHDGG